MIETGSPLSCPSSPLIRAIRPTATRASCWRWARLRWSLSIWACAGVPAVQGSGSSGLHMPGAAYLAKIASKTADPSGVSSPLMVDIASERCLPFESPRLRARSVSSGSGPSWSSRNRVKSAASLSSLGPTPTAVRTRSTSNCSRVTASTKPGSLSMALRMTSTCSPLISPWTWAAAIAGSTGGNDAPVNARRGANNAASVNRRLASVVEIRQRIASTSFQDLAPISCAVVSTCNRASKRWLKVGS